jgi:hypothetical protein
MRNVTEEHRGNYTCHISYTYLARQYPVTRTIEFFTLGESWLPPGVWVWNGSETMILILLWFSVEELNLGEAWWLHEGPMTLDFVSECHVNTFRYHFRGSANQRTFWAVLSNWSSRLFSVMAKMILSHALSLHCGYLRIHQQIPLVLGWGCTSAMEHAWGHWFNPLYKKKKKVIGMNEVDTSWL